MTERAEGFWWVRRGYVTAPWEVVKLERMEPPHEHQWMVQPPGVRETFLEDDTIAVWGPYLGKEPETVESLERKISEAFAAAVPRFVIPPQRDG